MKNVIEGMVNKSQKVDFFSYKNMLYYIIVGDFNEADNKT